MNTLYLSTRTQYALLSHINTQTYKTQTCTYKLSIKHTNIHIRTNKAHNLQSHSHKFTYKYSQNTHSDDKQIYFINILIQTFTQKEGTHSQINAKTINNTTFFHT